MTLNLVAVPVLAALAAGTGAVATFVNGSAATPPVAVTATLPVAAPARADQPCAAQTWPYIDSKCMTSAQARPKVRMVMAPRSNETPDDVSGTANGVPAAAVPQAPAAAPEAALTSRDTVLRQPDVLAPAPKASKSRDKRSEPRRRERRLVTQSYQVPAEFDRRSRAVLVVRPLRLEAFR
jgi:hypothetical protein